MNEKEEVTKGETTFLEVTQFHPTSGAAVPFERLCKYIEKIEKGVRVAVFKHPSGKYLPLTKVGGELVHAYIRLGFSFIPSVVKEPPKKDEEKLDEDMIAKKAALKRAFLEAQMGFVGEAPPRQRFFGGGRV